MKKPSFQFYTGDWLKDPKLSMCQPLARGIWIDLLCAMHENEQSGEIEGTVGQLARICRCSPDEMQVALTELTNTKTATVFVDSSVTFPLRVTLRNEIVTVRCRRMFEEAKHRKDGRERQERYRKKQHGNENVTPHSSTSYSSVTNVTGEKAADFEEVPVVRRIWKDGLELLKQNGMAEKPARALLGKLAGEYGKESLAESVAIAQAKNPANVEQYLIATLQKRGNGAKPEKLKSPEEVEKEREKFRKKQNLENSKVAL